jgi:catechol 2,3-dioxygenase-like lactoylglutathione lyase family enzyme
MKLEGVCIAVSDVGRAKKFYQDLFGLEVFGDYGINITFYGGLSLQQDFDWLLDISRKSIMKKSHNMELYFEEEDFDGFLIRLKRYPDIKYLGDGVKERSWGQRSITFYDPDDHIIEVGEKMAGVVSRFLSSGLLMEELAKRIDMSAIEARI